jgi:hypothetical protein
MTNTTKNQWAVEILESNMEGFTLEEKQQYLDNVVNYGCISGCVSGVIYYRETQEIFKEHLIDILQVIEDYNEEAGYDVVAQNVEDYSTFYNWAVWFIVEMEADEMRENLPDWDEDTKVNIYDDCDNDSLDQETTVAGAREKLRRLWEDTPEEDEENAPSDDDINNADFDELNEMLQGSGYYMERA